MLFRRVLLAALVAAPLAWSPAPMSAQERGLSKAQASTAQAESVAGWTNNRAVNRPTTVPKGISNAFGAEGTLPPGIRHTFPAPAPAPPPDSEPCTPYSVIIVDGAFVTVDCNGDPA
jgi:hypothetical protein